MTEHLGPAAVALGLYLCVGLILAMLLSRRGEERATALCALACWPWMLGMLNARSPLRQGPMNARILAFFANIEVRARHEPEAEHLLSLGRFPELVTLRDALLRADRRLALVDEILGEEERAQSGVDLGALREARGRVLSEIEQVLCGLRQLRIQFGLLALSEVQGAMGEQLRVRLQDLEARVRALDELGALLVSP